MSETSRSLARKHTQTHLNIINTQDQSDSLRGKLDRTCRYQQRLQHVLLEDIGHQSFPNVDTGVPLSQSMSVSQLGDDGDWV